MDHVSKRERNDKGAAPDGWRFQALIEQSWDAIVLLDTQGAITYASPSTGRILGYRADEFVGRNLFELVHPEDLATVQSLFQLLSAKPGGTQTVEFRARHKNGSWRWIEAIGTNLLHEPGIEGIVGNYHDITGRKELEQELRDHAAQLQHANRRKDEFLAVMAHELRNPLASVLNGIHIIKQLEKADTPISQIRDLMERQVQHLARLVDDLLEIAHFTDDSKILTNDSRPEEPSGSSNGDARTAIPASKRRILVVDDNRDAAKSLAMLLRLDGHEVRVAHDGQSALAKVQTERPEIVFLDIGMPGMDGYEVAKELRKLAGSENMVLVALTGYGQEADRRRSEDAGFDNHLVKPVEVGDIKAILAQSKLCKCIAGERDAKPSSP
jgi:PAS domain S-box-containing protein